MAAAAAAPVTEGVWLILSIAGFCLVVVVICCCLFVLLPSNVNRCILLIVNQLSKLKPDDVRSFVCVWFHSRFCL